MLTSAIYSAFVRSSHWSASCPEPSWHQGYEAVGGAEAVSLGFAPEAEPGKSTIGLERWTPSESRP